MSDPQNPDQPVAPPWAEGAASPAPGAPQPPTQPGYPQPGYTQPGYPAQPGYTQPGYQGGIPPYQTPPPSEGRGLGMASMFTGIGSVVFSFAIGGLAGIVAIVLGIIGLRKPAGRTFSIVGIITGAVGILIGILVLLLALVPFFLLSQAVQDSDLSTPPSITEPEPEPDVVPPGDLAFVTIDTPCYSFDGPAHFLNNISDDNVANCGTDLELWGEKQADGTILPTGVGAVFGSVVVEPVRASYVTENTATGTLDEVQAFLEQGYLLESGKSIIQTTDVPLGGVPAKVTFLEPNSEFTQLRAVVAVLPPSNYPGTSEELGLFLITVSTEEDNGEAILESVLNTWTWK